MPFDKLKAPSKVEGLRVDTDLMLLELEKTGNEC
jgi:hypothetical protein